VIQALQKIGFRILQSRNNQVYLRHPDGRCTTVAVHDGETIGPGQLALILRDCELWRRHLVDLL